jgi:hypothetical protein
MKDKLKFLEQQEYCIDEIVQLAEDTRQNAYIYSDTDLWCLVDELSAYKTVNLKLEKARSTKQLQKIMRPYLSKQSARIIFG